VDVHINEIIEILWEKYPNNGNINLLIGSGFSKNADPHFPDWPELSKKIIKKLYPKAKEGDDVYNFAKVPLHVLRLAEEYVAKYNKKRLIKLIKEVINDKHYNPGELHKRLFEFPWNDIFTTNFDTLLDRTEKEKKIIVIRSEDALYKSLPPRIIKLHGSIDVAIKSEFLVITEEDYRKYPQEHAIFQNTIRQALIEKPLIIFGFSGGDPNFSHWIGWIRDNRKKFLNQIYLFDREEDDKKYKVQKTFLKKFNIKFINLNRISSYESNDSIINSKDSFIENNRFTSNNDKFKKVYNQLFDMFEKERPKEIHNYNGIKKIEKELNRDIVIKTCNIQNTPTVHNKWPYSKMTSLKSKPTQQDILAISDYFQEIRSTYPGWILAPKKNREKIILRNIEDHIPTIIKDFSNDFNCIKFINNLFWIYRLKLESLSHYQIKNIRYFMDSIQGDKSLLNDIKNNPEMKKEVIELLLNLITDARENKEMELIKKYIKQIEILQFEDNLLKQRFYAKKVLNILYSFNIPELIKLLGLWEEDKSIPFYRLMKASIYCEINEIEKANNILEDVLVNLNKYKPGTIENKAIEGTCLYLLEMIENDIWQDSENQKIKEYKERLNKLEIDKCNLNEEIKEMSLDVRGVEKNVNNIIVKVKQFDPFSYKYSTSWKAMRNETGGANQFINIFDYLPVPMHCRHWIPVNDMVFENAFISFKLRQPLYAVPFLFRYHSLKLVQKHITRTFIASLDENDYKYLIMTYLKTFQDNITYYIKNTVDLNFWEPVLSSQIEFVSRLIFRMDYKHIKVIIKTLMILFAKNNIPKIINLLDYIDDLLKRIGLRKDFFIIDNIKEIQFLFDFFIPDEHFFGSRHYSFPESLVYIHENISCVINKLTISRDRIEKLLKYAESPDELIKRYALVRLVIYDGLNKITKTERDKIKQLIWSEIDASYGLPVKTGLSSWIFIKYNPEGNNPYNKLKQYLLSFDYDFFLHIPGSIGGKSTIIKSLEDAISLTEWFGNLIEIPEYIDWKESELKGILNKIINTMVAGKYVLEKEINKSPLLDTFFNAFKNNIELLFNFICLIILPYIKDLDDNQKQFLIDIFYFFKYKGVFLYQLLPFISKESEEILTKALHSLNEEEIKCAVQSIIFWKLRVINDLNPMKFPEKLIMEIISILRFRRQPGLFIILKFFEYLLNRINSLSHVFSQEQISDILQSLEWLESESKLPSVQNILTEGYRHPLGEIEEIPDSRAMLSEIVVLLYQKFSKEFGKGISILENLKEVFKKDNFPEVRNPWLD